MIIYNWSSSSSSRRTDGVHYPGCPSPATAEQRTLEVHTLALSRSLIPLFLSFHRKAMWLWRMRVGIQRKQLCCNQKSDNTHTHTQIIVASEIYYLLSFIDIPFIDIPFFKAIIFVWQSLFISVLWLLTSNICLNECFLSFVRILILIQVFCYFHRRESDYCHLHPEMNVFLISVGYVYIKRGHVWLVRGGVCFQGWF